MCVFFYLCKFIYIHIYVYIIYTHTHVYICTCRFTYIHICAVKEVCTPQWTASAPEGPVVALPLLQDWCRAGEFEAGTVRLFSNLVLRLDSTSLLGPNWLCITESITSKFRVIFLINNNPSVIKNHSELTSNTFSKFRVVFYCGWIIFFIGTFPFFLFSTSNLLCLSVGFLYSCIQNLYLYVWTTYSGLMVTQITFIKGGREEVWYVKVYLYVCMYLSG